MPSLPVLEYGSGANRVELLLGEMQPLHIRSCYTADSTQYLYSHVVAEVTFVVNPRATQPPGRRRGAAGDPRLVEHGYMPSEAIPRLYTILSTPRQKLVIRRGDRVLLESPPLLANGQSAPCDCCTGPNPIDVSFSNFFADRTCFGQFRVETWLNLSRRGANQPPVTVIGHEYTPSVSMDPATYLMSRRISGRITLRRDLMEMRRRGDGLALKPEDFWPSLAWPVPNGYMRGGVHVRYSSDGQHIEYDIEDVQPGGGWCIRAGWGIMRVSGWQEESCDWLQLGLPTMTKTIHLEVEGFPRTRTADLVRALSTVYSTMTNFAGRPIAGQDRNLRPGLAEAVTIRCEYPRRHASVTLRRSSTGIPFGGAVLGVGAAVRAIPGPADPNLYAENFGRLGGPPTQAQLAAGAVQAVNPAPLLRGTTTDPLLSAVAQALVVPGQEPTRPANRPARRPMNSLAIAP